MRISRIKHLTQRMRLKRPLEASTIFLKHPPFSFDSMPAYAILEVDKWSALTNEHNFSRAKSAYHKNNFL